MFGLQSMRLMPAMLIGVMFVTVPPAKTAVLTPAEFHAGWASKAFSAAAAATPLEVPFSFVYGGRPSRESLGKWNRIAHVKCRPTAIRGGGH